MTEKRFTIVPSNFIEDGFFIKDNIGNFSFSTTKDKSSLVMYEKNLNKLSTDCRQLKKENEQLKTQLDCIQNLISEHIKHQKTELGQKALKEVIQDYNKWLLEPTGDDLE